MTINAANRDFSGTRCGGLTSAPRVHPKRIPRRRGFSLIELIIVLLVTSILAGMLMPAMMNVRENVHRVVCSSNLRQQGIGLTMYTGDYKERFPYTSKLISPTGVWEPHELMAVHHGDWWDGLGLLFVGEYCSAPACFYCPSHRGEHTMQRYAQQWENPIGSPIYINFHYAGHRDWKTGATRSYVNLDKLVLATDGLRTANDFNHQTGLNALRGDGAVRWREDVAIVAQSLPEHESQGWSNFSEVWGEIEREE